MPSSLHNRRVASTDFPSQAPHPFGNLAIPNPATGSTRIATSSPGSSSPPPTALSSFIWPCRRRTTTPVPFLNCCQTSRADHCVIDMPQTACPASLQTKTAVQPSVIPLSLPLENNDDYPDDDGDNDIEYGDADHLYLACHSTVNPATIFAITASSHQETQTLDQR